MIVATLRESPAADLANLRGSKDIYNCRSSVQTRWRLKYGRDLGVAVFLRQAKIGWEQLRLRWT